MATSFLSSGLGNKVGMAPYMQDMHKGFEVMEPQELSWACYLHIYLINETLFRGVSEHLP